MASMEGCDMRKVLATILVLAPLLAGCQDGEPILPELKGRWDVISLHNQGPQTVGQSSQPQRVTNTPQPPALDNCNVTYVTFTKQGVVLRTLGIPLTVFPVTEAKRANARITLTAGAKGGKIELLMKNGELRFDDIYDPRGRSLRYERLPDGHNLRSKGANTVGEAFGLLLDLKPCKA
jgi:hypothetical protein